MDPLSGPPPVGSVPAPLPRVSRPVPPASPRLREAAQGFEAILLGSLLRGLRQTIPSADPKASFTRRFYDDLLDQYLATHLAKSGGIGLADQIERSLSGAPAARGHRTPLEGR